MNHYCISGLTVASDLPLPGAVDVKIASESFDVVIRSTEQISDLLEPEQSGPTWALTGNSFLLDVPNVARFLLTNGRDVRYAVATGAEPGDAAAFLLGTVFGILLHQRGTLVLHASAVEVAGQAVLFCGRSGAGKSTLAAALNKRGYPVLIDDVCAIELGKGRPVAQPDGRLLKLWWQAAHQLDLLGRQVGVVRQCLEKFYFEADSGRTKSREVGAIYLLRDTVNQSEPSIQAFNVAEAAKMLRRQAYRPALIRSLGQEESYFRQTAQFASYAPAFALSRNLDFALMDSVVAALEDHWAGISTLRSAA